MVPPRAEAAKPVDAVTKVVSLGKVRSMCFSSSDLPVPAQPVKNTLLPSLHTQPHSLMIRPDDAVLGSGGRQVLQKQEEKGFEAVV